ncbi:MAG: hypothetical protein JNL01_01875 [Bdellovibrionales bacterium]|nr:hypothetical protein [Bdellovibrionales bacterium]
MNTETAEDSLKELEKYRSQLVDQVEKLQAPLNHPAAQKALTWASRPELTDAVQEVLKHPHLKDVAFWELGFSISFWVIRIWLSTRQQSFPKKLATSFLGFLFYWTITLFVLPFALLGASYEKLVHVIWEIIKTSM